RIADLMSNASIESSHGGEVFNPSLIFFKSFNCREIGNDNEGASDSTFVFVQSGRGEDHMQNSANRMVDRHLNFSRMPATTEGEDERPADFRRQDTNQCA